MIDPYDICNDFGPKTIILEILYINWYVTHRQMNRSNRIFSKFRVTLNKRTGDGNGKNPR